MNSAPATPAEKLTEFSLRLSQAVEEDAAGWVLPAWLVAMIVAFIKEIAESFAELAKLMREGKIPLQPSAPHGTRCPARTATKRTGRSSRTARLRPATPELPVAPTVPEAEELPAAAPRAGHPAQSPQTPPLRWPHPAPTGRACGPPIPFSRFAMPLPWHAHNVPLSY